MFASFLGAAGESPAVEPARKALEAGLGDGSAFPIVPEELVDKAATVDTTAVAGLIDALGALQKTLEGGETPDGEMLADIGAQLDELAETLGIDLSALKNPDGLKTLIDRAEKGGSPFERLLARVLAPLSQPAGGDDAALAEIGNKLGALLAALQDGAVAPEKLAEAGMAAPGQAADGEIEAALTRLSAGKAVPEEPALATPSLKLTEPALGGKTADAPTMTAPAPANDLQQSRPETGSQQDRPQQDRSPAMAATAPAPVDASGTPAPSAPVVAEQAGMRIDATANPRIVQTGYQTSQQQLNLPQIAFEMARQIEGGNSRFQIRLDPPELGRIDVRLEIDAGGQVNARLTVEKAETLDLMQRDQRGLERALQQAGLDANKTNLEFSLKQNPFAGQDGQPQGRGRDLAANQGTGADEAAADPAPTVTLYRGSLQASGVNIIA